jgi:hypothetical protein
MGSRYNQSAAEELMVYQEDFQSFPLILANLSPLFCAQHSPTAFYRQFIGKAFLHRL